MNMTDSGLLALCLIVLVAVAGAAIYDIFFNKDLHKRR